MFTTEQWSLTLDLLAHNGYLFKRLALDRRESRSIQYRPILDPERLVLGSLKTRQIDNMAAHSGSVEDQPSGRAGLTRITILYVHGIHNTIALTDLVCSRR